MLAFAGQAGEIGEAIDGEVDLAGAAPELEPADLLLELGTEGAGLEQVDERPTGIDRRQDRPRPDLLAALDGDADRSPATLHDDPGHRRLGSDLGTVGARRVGDRV